MNGDLQYISDSLLIESCFGNQYIVKNADSDFSLDSIAASVKTFVKGLIDFSSPKKFAVSVLKLLEPGIFFSIHPLLGILAGIASEFGFSVTDILADLISPVKETLLSGQKVTPESINQSGKAIIATSSLDELRNFLVKRSNLNLIKEAGIFSFITKLFRKIGGGKAGRGKAGRGKAGRGKAKGLLVGFLGWFLKTALMGAGLLAVGKATESVINGGDDKEEEVKPEGAAAAKPVATPTRVPSIPSSGTGSQFHENDADTAWVVPLSGGIENTLLDWAVEIYPDLNGYDSIISRLPSFIKILDLLKKDWDSSKPNYLIIPPGFNRRVDIVNVFANDAVDKIQQINP
jgi:hypothetical protein